MGRRRKGPRTLGERLAWAAKYRPRRGKYREVIPITAPEMAAGRYAEVIGEVHARIMKGELRPHCCTTDSRLGVEGAADMVWVIVDTRPPDSLQSLEVRADG